MSETSWDILVNHLPSKTDVDNGMLKKLVRIHAPSVDLSSGKIHSISYKLDSIEFKVGDINIIVLLRKSKEIDL